MHPFYPTPFGEQRFCVQPVPNSSATGGRVRLSRPAATQLLPPMAVHFNQDYPPQAMGYPQPSWFARPINPVADVRPALYPFSLRFPVNSTTEMDPVTPANSPNPPLWETTAFDQTDTNNEEADVTGIAKPLNTSWSSEADSTQSSKVKADKKVNYTGKRVRTRINYTAAQRHVLRKQFDQTPYITREEASRLASNLEIEISSVFNWFRNERRRAKVRHSSSARP